MPRKPTAGTTSRASTTRVRARPAPADNGLRHAADAAQAARTLGAAATQASRTHAGASVRAAPAVFDPCALPAPVRERMTDRVAALCRAAGWVRIALFGGGRHTAPIIRQPWAWHGVRVVAVIDDAPQRAHISGVPVVRPDELREAVHAVVVSSDAHEPTLAARAQAVFGPRGIPVLRIYGQAPAMPSEEASVARLTGEFGISPDDARFLVMNRAERHDALLPMLPPRRTEMHIRRYEAAARLAEGARVLDAACGTGYGSRLLAQWGAAAVLGVDIDERAIDYAARRYTLPGRVSFARADVTRTGVADGSVDLVTSFETIEHLSSPDELVREFHRVLRPGGMLVLSTPFEGGATAHHEQSFTEDSLRALLHGRFEIRAMLGQVEGDWPRSDGQPAGMFDLADAPTRPETMLVIAKRREREVSGAPISASPRRTSLPEGESPAAPGNAGEVYDRVIRQHEGYNAAERSPGFRLCLQHAERLRGMRGPVCDVGCGVGFVLDLLQHEPFNFETWGADVSAHAVQQAKARAGHDRVALVKGGRVPFDTGAFGLVTCFDVLEHLEERELPAMRDELRRLVRAGGWLVCSASCRASGSVDHLGRNLHLTVRPASWWIDLFAPDEAVVRRREQDVIMWWRRDRG